MPKNVAQLRNLHRISYGGGFTIWCYTIESITDDPSVEWILDNCNQFFRNYIGPDEFRTGDQLIISDRIRGYGAIRFIRKIENGSDIIFSLVKPI